MKIEYGFEGQLYEVADISGDSPKVLTFKFRAPPRHVSKKLIESPWVDVLIEFLDNETAKVDFPNSTEIRGGTFPLYQRSGESLIIDIGDCYVFHCRIQH